MIDGSTDSVTFEKKGNVTKRENEKRRTKKEIVMRGFGFVLQKGGKKALIRKNLGGLGRRNILGVSGEGDEAGRKRFATERNHT